MKQKGFKESNQFRTLLRVTGSGKTFTMANVNQALNKPTLVTARHITGGVLLNQKVTPAMFSTKEDKMKLRVAGYGQGFSTGLVCQLSISNIKERTEKEKGYEIMY